MGLLAGVAVVAGIVADGGVAVGQVAGGLVWMVIFGGLGALGIYGGVKSRKARVSVDSTGLWFFNGKAQNVIPWQGLAGVGLYWSPMGRGTAYSLELCPNGPIDRDDPVLWPLVRDEDPPHPTLPRLRYRLPLTFGAHEPVVRAVRDRVPHLWLGESERRPGHVGRSDAKGHRERTRTRGGVR
ncbi:hypothetical protein [Streptomyces sp. NPDC002851]